MAEDSDTRSGRWGPMRAAMRAGFCALRTVRFSVRDAPVSLGAVGLIWVLGIATGSVGGLSGEVLHRIGVGVVPIERGRWWTPLTAGLWVPGLAGYLTVTVLIVLIGGPVERRIGWKRFLTAAIVTQVLGSLVGVVIAGAVKIADRTWALHLHLGVAVGPTTWIVGVLMVATVRMNVLWRRRVRTALVALLLTMALFAGQLQDVIRLAAALIGVALGSVLLGPPARSRIAGTRREGRVLVALVVAATALGPALAMLSPHAVGPLAVLRDLFHGAPYTPDQVREICAAAIQDTDCARGELQLRLAGVGPTLMSVMPSLFLLVCSDGLRRGRRSAWIVTTVAQLLLVGFSVLNVVVRYVRPHDLDSLFYVLQSPTAYRSLVPFLTPLAVLIVLVRTRRYFDVPAPVGTYRRFFGRCAGLLVASGVLYLLLGMTARHGFDRPITVTMVLQDFPQRLVPPVYLQWINPILLPDDNVTTLLYEWTGVVLWAIASVWVWNTFRVPTGHVDPDDASRARIVLRGSGASSLAWMTTWPHNRYWFSPDGSSFVAYRAIGGVALTVSDPVGSRDQLRGNVIGFAKFAVANGWTPCFYSVSAEVKQITDELGWAAMQVAEETVLDLSTLEFKGKRFQDVRTALNRARKHGITAQWIRFPSAPDSVKTQITDISREWLSRKDTPEMGFTLGGVAEIDDEHVRCLIAVDAEGQVHGVTSWLPVHRDGCVVGWTLDLMRRRSDGFASTMEFLIATAARDLRDEGAEVVSLSGAPLATLDREMTGAAHSTLTLALGGLLDLLGRTLEPVYGFRSLLAFKAKFQPDYSPMYMCFPDHAALPSIGTAIARAYLPHTSMRQTLNMVGSLLDR